MDKNTLVAVVLGVLVLVAALQAFQLNSLRNAVSGGATISTKTQQAPAPTSAPSQGSPSLPPSLQNLPDMVGGC